MNKKIFLTCLAAGILVFLLPAREVKAAENQTTEDYYYQLLINGEYPYNTGGECRNRRTCAGGRMGADGGDGKPAADSGSGPPTVS